MSNGVLMHCICENPACRRQFTVHGAGRKTRWAKFCSKACMANVMVKGGKMSAILPPVAGAGRLQDIEVTSLHATGPEFDFEDDHAVPQA